METEKCEICGAPITWKVYRYSMSQMQKALCLPHQQEWRTKNMPPKLAEFLNKTVKQKYTGYE